MPGVPSGRGCNGCRKQKKKCDEAKPSCSRCTRLGVPCIGAGVQRFKFQQEPGNRDRGSKDSSPARSSNDNLTVAHARSKSKSSSPGTMPAVPASDWLTLVAAGFINAIKPATDLRFNLSYSFGGWLNQIPARLGKNAALDAAADAIVDAHAEKCSFQPASQTSLAKYSKALGTLRDCLNDPTKSTSTETLAAVLMLMYCQHLLGISNSYYTTHGEGAAQILKIRGRYYDPNDKFECMLILALRGPVVFEACFNPRIQFSPSEWHDLVASPLDASLPQGKMMTAMANMPIFIKRGNAFFEPAATGLPIGTNYLSDPTLFSEVEESYRDVKIALRELSDQLLKIREKANFTAWSMQSGMYIDSGSRQSFTATQCIYGVGLVIGIIHDVVLDALAPIFNLPFERQAEDYAQHILGMWENISQYKPIASTCLGLFLNAAWAATKSEETRLEIERVIRKLEDEKAFLKEKKSAAGPEMEDIRRHLMMFRISTGRDVCDGRWGFS